MSATDKILLLAADALLVLACLNLWDVCFGILLEHYLGRFQRYHKQRYGENYQCPSKPNKFVRLSFQSRRIIFLLVGDDDERGNLTDKPIRLSGKIFRLFYPLFGKLLLCVCNLKKFFDLLRKPVCLSGKFVGGFFRIFRKKNKQARCLDGQITVGGSGVVDVNPVRFRNVLSHFLNNLVRFGVHARINPRNPRQVNIYEKSKPKKKLATS